MKIKKITCIVFVFFVISVFLFPIVSDSAELLDASRSVNDLILNGEVEYHSIYSHEARPQYMGDDGIKGLIEYAEQAPKIPITYETKITAYFKGDKINFLIEKEPCQYYPKPIYRSYIYNGEQTYCFDHAINLVTLRKAMPYRESNLGNLYFPPKSLGYDVDGVLSMAGNVVSALRKSPSLTIVEKDNIVEVTGSYEGESTDEVIARIEWDPDSKGIFKRCVYRYPPRGEFIEIVTDDLEDYGNVQYPSRTVIRQIVAPSIDQLEQGKVASEQILLVMSASFNTDTVTDDLFSTETPDGYFLQTPETLRAKYSQK